MKQRSIVQASARFLLATGIFACFAGCLMTEQIATPKTDSPDETGGAGGASASGTGGEVATGTGGEVATGTGGLSPAGGGGQGGSRGWVLGEAMNEARAEHTMTALPDGRILVTGGFNEGGLVAISAEIRDPVTGQWAFTAPMLTPRARHTATLLDDGRVLVAGGYDGQSETASAEIYDASTGLWAPSTGLMTVPRMYHAAERLPSGDVLIASGCCDAAYGAAEVYRVALDTFTATDPLKIAHAAPTLTVLPDGAVLLVGNSDLPQTETYDDPSGTWASVGSLASPRNAHAAIWDPGQNGVMVIGGISDGATTQTVEIYDPGGGGWSSLAPLSGPRYGHTATWLSGVVVVAGGHNGQVALGLCEVVQGGACPDLHVPRYLHRALRIDIAGATGVLVTGGFDEAGIATSSVETGTL